MSFLSATVKVPPRIVSLSVFRKLGLAGGGKLFFIEDLKLDMRPKLHNQLEVRIAIFLLVKWAFEPFFLP